MSKNFELIQQAEINLGSTAIPAKRTFAGASTNGSAAVELNIDKVTREESQKLVQRVFLAQGGENPRVVVFAGVDHGNGCSQICAQTARILADNVQGTVCLLDANLRTPSLPDIFGVTNHHGLTDALLQEDSVKNYAKPLTPSNLWLLSCGSLPAGSSFMLTSARMKARVNELRKEFDYVLVDAPPLNDYSDALALGQISDGLVLVLEANATRRESAVRIADTLRASQIRVLGAVLNKRTFPIPEGLYSRL
ncbi:MAG: CpsD/CapB family tyrosine-protein kinase [Candidatus Acidiferrales bacterium]